MNAKKIKVVVAGALGKMGQESVRTILEAEDLELVGAVVRKNADEIGCDIGEIIGLEACGIEISDNLKDCLQRTQAQVMLDFTVPGVVCQNACISLECGARPILGATGLNGQDMHELARKSEYLGSAVLIAPNFSIGMILLIEAAKKIAKYFPHAEVIELHHDKKIDAPSGTSIKTAHELSKIITSAPQELSNNSTPRGELVENIKVHSIRLPGLLAHEEILFGGLGQLTTLRHDTFNRAAFMPGVLLAIRQIMNKNGLIYGLENLLDQ